MHIAPVFTFPIAHLSNNMDAGWIYNLNLIALTGNIRKHLACSVQTAFLVENFSYLVPFDREGICGI